MIRSHSLFILISALILIFARGAESRNQQRQAAEPINIGLADVESREVQLMAETKRRLLARAQTMLRDAKSNPKILNTANYADAYDAFQDDLERARKRVWWKKTD